MLQIRGLENLKNFIAQCVRLGQANPFGDAKKIAEDIIKELKKKIIRRVK